jgi:penicillin-binding protein 1A
MTDMLSAVVEHGTGTGAQLGRPTAGKTGTTSSNRDGWFVGFSSGLTTGVWMGRDDSRVVGGLYGGRAPARAFHDFMVPAVAHRAVEPFQTEATAPDWQVDPDQEMWLAPPDDNAIQPQPLVDEDGNPVGTPPADPYGAGPDDSTPPAAEPDADKPQARAPPAPAPAPRDRLNDQWLDRALRDRPARRDPRRPEPVPRDRDGL